MVKVLLIGAGKGGQAVLSRLLQFDWVSVVGVHDVDPNAPGLILARQAKLPIFVNEPLERLPTGDVDLVFDLTGNPSVQARLTTLPSRSFDLVTGQVSQLLWNVIQTLEEREIQVREYLREHQVLADINLMLSQSQTPEQIFDAIVTGGTRITEMPSGSLSIVNHEKNELFLVAAKGFSSGFYRDHAVYPVRSGGLTEHILRQTEPVVVPNIADYPAFQNPVLIKEGIRSLIALPLISDRGPVGILYVDDFRPRTFSPSILGMLKPLATQAVLAIQKQQAFEQIRTLSIRDPLTNLYNRRYLNEIVVGELDRAVRLRQPLSVIVIDIDHFKLINDRWGHVVGDQVLRGMAQVLSRYVRAYDTVTRFGGEEFVILMAQTGEDEALALAERIRLETAHERLLPEEYVVTCSFGVNTLVPDAPLAPTPEEFIHRADQALYDAKHAGRNCVRVFGSVCP
jgi:diguanylate cyclase (GGDEF)-like protein